MSIFQMGFDVRSLEAINRLENFDVLLMTPAVRAALAKAGDIITAAAVQNTWERFQNPSGVLAGSLHPVMDSPYQVIVGSDDPKAWRREAGFSGMTDSLGRFFPYDPGVFYASDALKGNTEAVMGFVEYEMERALERLNAY